MYREASTRRRGRAGYRRQLTVLSIILALALGSSATANERSRRWRARYVAALQARLSGFGHALLDPRSRVPQRVLAMPAFSFLKQDRLRGVDGVTTFDQRQYPEIAARLFDNPNLQMLLPSRRPLHEVEAQFKYLFEVGARARRLGHAETRGAWDRLTIFEVPSSGQGEHESLARLTTHNRRRLDDVRQAMRRGGGELRYIDPYMAGWPERDLALALELPLLGNPELFAELALKPGGRRFARDHGLVHPKGAYEARFDVASLAEDVDALLFSSAERQFCIKSQEGFSGEGNHLLDTSGLREMTSRPQRLAEIAFRIRHRLKHKSKLQTDATFLDELNGLGMVVEEWQAGVIASPSGVVFVAPDGLFRIAASSGQLFDSATGQEFMGATSPAAPEHRRELFHALLATGKALAESGFLGYAAMDYVTSQTGKLTSPEQLSAVDLNPRRTGSRATAGWLELLGARYHAALGRWVGPDGRAIHLKAQDHVRIRAPSVEGLPAKELYRLIERNKLSENVFVGMASGARTHGVISVATTGSTEESVAHHFEQAANVLEQ